MFFDIWGKNKFNDIHGGYADAVRDLHCILLWPSARIQALGFALSGSLVDGLDGCRNVSGNTLDCSEELIGTSGLGAIQYEPESVEEDDTTESYVDCIQETQALINRTLIVWLTALGIMTLGGWLS